MATLSLHINNTKKAPHFDGTNYAFWKVKMIAHLKSINREVWKATEIKFEVANPNSPTPVEEKKLQCNDVAISALHEALDDKVFEQIKNITIAHEAWTKLEESYEGDEGIKAAKAYILNEKLASFKMKEDESVSEMFHRLETLVNELKACGEEIKDKHFSMKFLRCLPKRFDNLRTIMVKTTLSTSTPNQVLAEVMTDDMYRDDDMKEELIKKNKKKEEDKDEKKKGVAFMSTSSTSKGKELMEDIDDEQMALFVKKFGSFMRKGYSARRKKSSSKKHDENMKCYRCHSKKHLIAKCPYDSDDEDAIRKEKKKQKKKQEKKEKNEKKSKKKNESHVASWDSDASSSESESESSSDEDDKKKKKKKGHASIAMHNKVSIFDAPSTCFMAKANKVQSVDDSDASDDSDDEDVHTKQELVIMLKDCANEFMISRKECKGLRGERDTLKQELEELRATYESLKVDQKKLEKAHSKLEKAHSSLQQEKESMMANNKEEPRATPTCDIGITCDIIDESFFVPIVVAPANPSCSTSTSTSSSSVDHPCDTTLVVENNNLEEEVKKLNHTLAKAYGGEDRLLMCLGSQRVSLYKEGLGYTPRKARPPLLLTRQVL